MGPTLTRMSTPIFVPTMESTTKEQALNRKDEKESISSNTSKETIEDINEVIRELEDKGVQKIIEASKSNESLDKVQESLLNFMKNGSEEFKERTGRQMSYSEMRSAWG
jgi:beta-phosphoglucomutase-like phosphatase (HAD superfamily)